MFLLYEGLLTLVFVVTLPFFLLLGILRGKYLANFRERIGFYRTPRRSHDLWIHAVSVGETLATRSVVDAIGRMRPGTSIVFTTTTLTGQAQAARLYPAATITYFPFDFGFSVRRFLSRHAPRVFVTVETELWPNVTRLAHDRGLRLLLANGRISDRSFPRYRAFRFLLAPLLRRYDRVLAREVLDAERFVAIGAPREIVEVTGNVKFDYEPPREPSPAEITALFHGRKVVVLGSTFEGEDELLLPEVERLVREHDLFFVVAPRKPERFDAVASLLERSTLRALRRSALEPSPDAHRDADVLLLDTIGELARVYAAAAVAFIGGSLVPRGGHNPIEPAAAGVPVCFGPHMSAFREVAAAFLDNRAAMEVGAPADFGRFVAKMVSDDAEHAAWSERARQTVARNRGASERTARHIVALLDQTKHSAAGDRRG